MILIDERKKLEIKEKFTKYEIARILGARALQLSMNAPVLIKLKKEEFEEIDYDPFKIAEAEFYQGILPISVKRPMPKKSKEKMIIERTSEQKTEDKKVKEEKLKEREEDREKLELEIIKEVENTEVMELAKPEDEEEVTEAAVEE